MQTLHTVKSRTTFVQDADLLANKGTQEVNHSGPLFDEERDDLLPGTRRNAPQLSDDPVFRDGCFIRAIGSVPFRPR